MEEAWLGLELAGQPPGGCVEGCQPRHQACGWTHAGWWEARDSANGAAPKQLGWSLGLAGARCHYPGKQCLLPRRCAGPACARWAVQVQKVWR